MAHLPVFVLCGWKSGRRPILPTVLLGLDEWLLLESSHLPLQLSECRPCAREHSQGGLSGSIVREHCGWSLLSHRWPDLGGHQEHAEHDISFLAWGN